MHIDNAEISKILPTNLEVFRKLRKMSQYDLGVKPGIAKNQAQISHYENGIHEPENDVLLAMKRALDFPLDASKLLEIYNANEFES